MKKKSTLEYPMSTLSAPVNPNDMQVYKQEQKDLTDHYLKKKVKKGKKLGSIKVSFYYYYVTHNLELDRFLDTNGYSKSSSKTSSRKRARNSTSAAIKIKRKKSIVNLMVIEAKNLKAVDWNNNTSDPYCKISIGKEKSKTFEVVRLAVNPSHQGRGIGRKLLEMVERFSTSRGATSLIANTISILESALSLYQSCEYQIEKGAALGPDLNILTLVKSVS